MQFLSNFRQTWWIRMLEMPNMAGIRSPVVFSGGIIAVFQMENRSN